MAIDYDKKTWGTYEWDDELTVAQNVTAARNADALIESADLQRIEDAVDELAVTSLDDITGLISQGTNVTITGNGTTLSPYVISAAGDSGGGDTDWGDIGGSLGDQTDLQNALNAKANTSALADVAFSGDYNDLDNKPAAAGGPEWGAITGTLGDQTDLQSALNAKANTSHTHTASNISDFNSAADARITASTTIVKTSGDQTVDGVKTFSSAPVVPDAAFPQEKINGLTAALAGKVGSSTVTTIWTGTQAAYDAISPKDSSVLYIVTE